MNKNIINLYEHFKNTEKKLKIVCDWDEVIQSCEPWALWVGALKEKNLTEEYAPMKFSKNFEEFWNCEMIKYSIYGSRLLNESERKEKGFSVFQPSLMKKQIEVKNSPNFYQEAPFLTIAEDLLKLIKEDKVERLIFLSAYDKREFSYPQYPCGDERKLAIFKETFAKCTEWIMGENKIVINLQLIPFENEQKGQSKAEWIKENASDFDIVIDDNPFICGSLVNFHLTCPDYCVNEYGKCPLIHTRKKKKTVIAPYYPAVEHDKKVLLVRNGVSGLKVGDFINNYGKK